MPPTCVYFYQDSAGKAPVIEWLRELRKKDRRGHAKCVARIRLLAAMGHELRRPIADYLRDGIYELRARHERVNYRILYFFHGREAAVLAHSLTKEDKVPAGDIERAIARKRDFEADPPNRQCEAEIDDG